MADGDIVLTVDLDTSVVEGKIKELTANLRNMANSAGGGNLVREFGRITVSLQGVSQQVTRVVEDLHRMESAGNVQTPQYQQAQQQLVSYANQLAIANARLQAHAREADNAGSRSNRAFRNASSGVSSYSRITQNALNSIKRSAEQAFSFKGITRGIKQLAQLVLGVGSFIAVLNKLKSIIREGMNNLVQFDSASNATNQAMTEIQTSLLYLKNAWASAFAPILNIVQPILTGLIDTLAKVGNMIARFIGVLTGQTRVLQAVRTSAGDYASSVGGVGSSAGKASKEVKKLNERLADFDDLNVLGKDKDDDDALGGAGGGAGGGGGAGIDDMFEYVDVDKSEFEDILKWIDAIKKKIEDSGLIEAIQRFWKAVQESELLDTIQKVIDTILETSFDTTLAILTDIFNILTAILELDLAGFLNGLKDLTIDISFAPLEMLAGIIDDICGTDFKTWVTNLKDALKELDVADLIGFTLLEGSLQDLSFAFDELIGVFDDFLIELGITNTELDKTALLTASIQAYVQLVGIIISAVLTRVATLITFVGHLVSLLAKNFAILKDIVIIVASVINGDYAKAWEYAYKLGADVLHLYIELARTIVDLIVGAFKPLLTIIDELAGTNITNNINNWLDDLQIKADEGADSLFGLSDATEKGDHSVEHFAQTVDATKDFIGGTVDTWKDKFTEWGNSGVEATDELSTGLDNVAVSVDGTSKGVDILGNSFNDASISAEHYGEIVEFSAGRSDASLDLSARNTTDWYNTVVQALDDTSGSWNGLGGTVETNGRTWVDTLGSIDTETGRVQANVTDNFSSMTTGVDTSTTDLVNLLNESWDMLGTDVPFDAQTMTDDVYNRFTELQVNSTPVWETLKTNVITTMQQMRTQVSTEATLLNTTLYNLFLKTQQEGTQQFNTLSSNVVSAFTNLANNAKSPMNSFLSSVESMVNHATDALNRLIDNVNQCLSMGSEWLAYMGLPNIGTQSHVPHVSIPRLAEGAVIPPNKEFLAILGDQSSGTNIEAPLDTIKQAVAEVIGSNGNEEVVSLLQELIQVVESKELTIGDKEIGKANARYVNQQRIIRGTSY